eukprot:TRINITY_DN35229_c0_g1_i1.p1 TRINITY_DN35229_c0_g1~~TRINITY_DN35229_c0_g1_i1.p1  ORF type:complete len:187 (+),score=36.60 TRINITY_DN35229_c0_g1_i1:507-1067(+)
MFKYFMQYMEGSLLDWQLGDLMPSCTAGDLRVSYSVQDPSEISVIGEGVAVRARRQWYGAFLRSKSDVTNYKVGMYKTAKGHQIGMVHAGFKSAKDMMDAEVRRQQLWCLLARLALALPALLVQQLRDLDWTAAVGLWLFGIAGLWMFLWGLQLINAAFMALACGTLAFAYIRDNRGIAHSKGKSV